MNAKFPALAVACLLGLAAGCDRNTSPTPASAPSTAGAGASTSKAPEVGPKGDEIKRPETAGDTKEHKALPDPGDANDHSTPAHDARQKADSGEKHDE